MNNNPKQTNEEFLHMQKLAGLITEEEYKNKINEDLKVFLNKFKLKNKEFKKLLKDRGYV